MNPRPLTVSAKSKRSLEEPSLLPARISNLLLNGSSGISVGMATNIPPHNLEELVDALSVLIHNPDAWVFLLTSVRGKREIEVSNSKSKSSAIIVKETKQILFVIEKLLKLSKNKNLDGISDIRDESDRSGMRIVIELKRGSDPSIVQNNLYRFTALQSRVYPDYAREPSDLALGWPNVKNVTLLISDWFESNVLLTVDIGSQNTPDFPRLVIFPEK
ncbi:DNA gyrase subunit A, chloroplastic/mitochondrial [Tanacetum coccineum]